jgi:hypothetical protein
MLTPWAVADGSELTRMENKTVKQCLAYCEILVFTYETDFVEVVPPETKKQH